MKLGKLLKVDTGSIVKAAKSRNPKQRVTLYLDKAVYTDFLKKCEAEDVAMSAVVEQLVREFNQSYKK